MHSVMHKARRSLAGIRRRFNQLIGRDLRIPVQLNRPTVRLGTDYGGWSIDPSMLNADSCVYSVGAGTDISFDLELIRRFNLHVHAFDPTPKSVEWLRSQKLPEQFHFHPIGLADYDGMARFTLPRPDYVSFHIDSHADGSIVAECPVRKLTTVMSDLKHNHLDLLKMDIEGAEYAVLEDLLRSNVDVRQLLVEFHHSVGNRQTLDRTRTAIDALDRAGYKVFAVSATGLEYSFIRM